MPVLPPGEAMRGRCVVCSWRSRLVYALAIGEGICWWCVEDGWRPYRPARRLVETVVL